MNIIIEKNLPKEAGLIREEVFIKEQGFSSEFDETDNMCYHLLLTYGEAAAATGRMYKAENENTYILGRIAVLKPYRKKGCGSIVVKALEDKARELKGEKCRLSAQCQAVPFYEKLGYTAYGEEYLDEHCPHISMEKPL